MVSNYDSTKDTNAHIAEVRIGLNKVCANLLNRGLEHDRSKLQEPEKEAFDRATTQLRGLTYGSPEYAAALEGLGVALEHHYSANSHHPQHYENGIEGMSLLDIVEMFCDWAAAVKRHDDGDLGKSIDINEKRFNISPQLAQILRNTQKELGW